MATIKPIDAESIHRINAGQVVSDLPGAIKELVENSLDAGATSVEVRIKDYGVEGLDVVDNGSGIAEADWESIGLKHHTSKLPELSFLPHVTTFGFRGEALSALCVLCESVTVITCTKETEPVGRVLKLGRDGRVLDRSQTIARRRGTTVSVTGLFHSIPVRRKEFERTAKRDFPKVLTLLYAYGLVPASISTVEGRVGVRLKVENIPSGKAGKKQDLLAIDGRGSLRASVNAIWGPKALEAVLDISLALEVQADALMSRREGLVESTQHVKVIGLISSAAWGQGRSSADRQFFYINGRPCELKAVARAVNEVYKSFVTNQSPMAILDFRIPTDSVDINVTPDKRTILLHSEANVIAALKAGLEHFYSPSRSSYALAGASHTVKLQQESEVNSATGATTSDTDLSTDTLEDERERNVLNYGLEADRPAGKSNQSDESAIAPDVPPNELQFEEDDMVMLPRQGPSGRTVRKQGLKDFFAKNGILSGSQVQPKVINTTNASWSPERKSRSSMGSEAGKRGREARSSLRERLTMFASQSAPLPIETKDRANEMEISSDDKSEGSTALDKAVADDALMENAQTANLAIDSVHGGEAPLAHSPSSPAERDQEQGFSPHDARTLDGPIFADQLDHKDDVELPNTPTEGSQAEDNSRQAGPSRTAQSMYRDEITSTTVSGEVTLRFDLSRLRKRCAVKRRQSEVQEAPKRDAYSVLVDGGIASAAGIANKDLAAAKEALSRVISKADFDRMDVLGQFNKGFIIARLRSESGATRKADDLFIIDQHASDEKYNFETLQMTTQIKAQSLIIPRPIQLTAGDEIVATENLNILRANGFEVSVDEDKLPGRGEKISLTAMPVSKETTFDLQDLEQLLHLVSDGARATGQMVRCSKARSMFAMRACRKSVMIGKTLTRGQMEKLVRNMGTIDQPWNCPHGRPTMRHLNKVDSGGGSPLGGRGRIDWAGWKARESQATGF